MSRFHFSAFLPANPFPAKSLPVNLIKSPIERVIVLVWLIGFAQFFSYSFINAATPTLSWLLTAPALMAASIIIAIRSQKNSPLGIAFITGLMVILFKINGDLNSVLLWPNAFNMNTYQAYSYEMKLSLMSISIYALLFREISTRFLVSRLFHYMSSQILPHRKPEDNDYIDLQFKFDTFIFYLSFFTINFCVLISLYQPDHLTLISLAAAIIFLFTAAKYVSAQVRGILLPVYVSLMLVTFVLSPSVKGAGDEIYNINLLVFTGWSLLLWMLHNFASRYYNTIFPDLKVTTSLWPWFGLAVLILSTLNQAPEIFIEPSYLVILIGYLFLMLRNTTMPLISWSMVLLVSWLFVIVLSLINPVILSLSFLDHFGEYGIRSLLFAFSLVIFSVLWDRTINRYFISLGWQKISFKIPVFIVSFLISILWLALNIILATGLISGWFDLIKEGLQIEKTSLFVLISFTVLYWFMNNKLLANLVHLSAIILLIVIWGGNNTIPVYLLFALIHLMWVMLPVSLNWLSERFVHNLNKTSIYWVYISFAAAMTSLFYMLDNYNQGIDSFVFLLSLGILFLASILLVKKSIAKPFLRQLWIVVAYLLATGLIGSLRFIFMGRVAVNAADTMGILVLTLLLFFINRFRTLPSPIISSDLLVKLLPLTALFTLSWQIASVHNTLTLFILGAFYLIIQKGNRLTLYSGFLLINLAVYLWMPMLSDYTNLLLFYVVPVSLSLLLITHLHRDEIKPALKNKIHFIALSSLYLVVTADIFINETLLVFLLGLLLGIASVIYSISSKTRIYLYLGVSFLVINVLGQLMVFYPDGRLGRALILMMTGAIITGSMIWFNIKREMLLSKIQLFRADLDSWK